MKYPKYYIGPMSKNVVDAIDEFCNETNTKIGLIPSRRQVEWDGGYVNNWTTHEFSNYVNKLDGTNFKVFTNPNIVIKRDHAGPGQGYTNDDGYESLKYDCKHLDMIHIDPWKQYPDYINGLVQTIQMVEYCYNINPSIQFEVGTEEAIKRFEIDELNSFVKDLKVNLEDKIFNQIKYLVIQSGTSLKGNLNTGEYDKDRLLGMVKIAKSFGLLSKEHNGDYIPVSLIKEKMSLGLDAINIAPEFGLIETLTYIDSGIDIDKFWEICFNSKRWEKWVDKNFNPYTQKLDLIKICGHYVLSDPKFLNIKPNIDDQIKSNIKTKLNELHT
tara:strand:- start:5716 stop:6699 length:984 start_codon:yes stop_codon:yes gene_type:complete